jgi:hypothetical protein
MAAICLACSATAVAADTPTPTPDPLWKAYPLDIAGSSRQRPQAAQQSATPTTSTTHASTVRLDPPSRHSAPVGAAIFLYAAIAGIVLCVAAMARAQLRRRRSRKPVTCEISWTPDDRGGAFRATVSGAGDKPRLLAESRRFARRSDAVPEDDAVSHDVHSELVDNLVSAGWVPYERGPHWWDLRLRPESSPRPPWAYRG